MRVLLQLDDYIAAAEDERILVTVFHPELTPSLAFHRYFARKCGLNPTGTDDAGLDPDWTPLSWTRFQFPRLNIDRCLDAGRGRARFSSSGRADSGRNVMAECQSACRPESPARVPQFRCW